MSVRVTIFDTLNILKLTFCVLSMFEWDSTGSM
jgi:hypothetical protein